MMTSYNIVYSAPREMEREAPCLSGKFGASSVVVGRPYFYSEFDGVSPIGAVLTSLCYIFYDCRLGSLKQSANFAFISKIMFPLAERAYQHFR